MTASPPCAIVTRPQPDCAALAADLTDQGFETIQAPMLEIAAVCRSPVDLAGVQAVLLTSAAAARNAGDAAGLKSVPVFAVGNATAAAARDAGFIDVASAAGDAEALAQLVTAHCDPGAGGLLHLSGNVVASDLAEALGDSEFVLHRTVVYEARPAPAMPAAAGAALADGSVDAVLFFSPRSAATFVNLVRRADAAAGCRDALAFCISAAVAEAASELEWRAVHRAARPNWAAMTNLIAAAFPSNAGKLNEPDKS